VQTFAELLGQYRTMAQLSCNQLGRAVGVDPSYISRLERGEREPPRRAVVLALARALDLPVEQADGLLAVAGYAPDCLVETMQRLAAASDPAMLAVQAVLQDTRLSHAGHQAFREVILSICEHWRPASAQEHAMRKVDSAVVESAVAPLARAQ
jgi:transcriptional regulator with XRE-family HTH domain